jgi:hypothetical protein
MLKQNLGAQIFEGRNDFETVLALWLITEDKDIRKMGIEKLALHYNKFLICARGYVKK